MNFKCTHTLPGVLNFEFLVLSWGGLGSGFPPEFTLDLIGDGNHNWKCPKSTSTQHLAL